MTKDVLIKDLMVKPITIAKSAKITEALDKMLAEGLDPLVTVHNNSVIGTVSRQAIAKKLGSKKNADLAPTSIHVANVVEPDFTSVYYDESVDVLIPLLQRYKLVVVYDGDNNLIGQISAVDLLTKIRPNAAIDKVVEKAVTIEASERVVHLRRRMLDDNISRFIVTERDKFVGIVTETDVAIAMRQFRQAVDDNHQDRRIRDLLIKDIMSAPLLMVERTTALSVVIDMMIKKNISSITVMDAGKLFGIITLRSLVNAL